MEYFWKQQNDIPAGMGYPLFGAAHFLSVAITLALVLTAVVIIEQKSSAVRKKVLKIIPIFMLGMEVFKDLFLVLVGRFGIGYLPLHVCSIGIFVFLLREYLPWRWSKDYFGEIAFVLIMPASIAALLFADWTIYYPVLNFINLHSYLWHGLLVLYPILLMRAKEISPSIKHLQWVISFLCVVVPPIYFFDKRFGCNYFFVNWPVSESPLSWLASFMGNPGYLVGYAVMAVSVIVLLYLFIWIGKTANKPDSNT